MKYLKNFNESENNFELQERIKETERLLYKLGHYKDGDGYWHVGENIRLPKYAEHDGKLVVKFWEVRGSFNIEYLDLKSLDGCPKSVYSIYCGNNSLSNLIGSPNEVSFNLSCRSCGLKSIEGHPEEIGGHFDISGNNIKDLKSFSNINCDAIHIYNNPIYSIVESWINIKSERWDLIEYFNDLDIVQDISSEKPKLIIQRLDAFFEDCDLSKKHINIEQLKKHYEIIE